MMLLAALAVLTTRLLYQSSQDRYVKEAFPLRAAARDVLLQMVNEETSVRGYLISGDSASLKPYYAAHPQAAGDVRALQRLTKLRPELAGDVSRIQGEVAQLQRFYRTQVTLIGEGPEGRLRAQSNIFAGKALFDEFRDTSGQLIARADAIVASAQHDQRRTFRFTVGVVVVAAIAALAIGLALLRIVPGRLAALYRREQEARVAAEYGARASRSLEHVVDAVVLLDADDVIRYWNPAAVTSFGVSEHDALNRSARQAVPALAQIDEALEQGGSTVMTKLALEDRESWFSVHESRFSEGRVLVLRDVTAEQQLERARSDFLATASHELRTPLSAVYGAARTLRRPEISDAELRTRLITMIEEEADRLAEIIDRILVSSQLDRHELRIEHERIDVRALCDSVLASTALRASPRHTLVLDAEEQVWAQSDPNRLRQVLVNLVDNALKYSPEGGIVELRVHRDNGDGVLIDVTDQGLGIAEQEHDQVFDKFFRADPEMIRGIGGSGLGLYISRELIEQMGGSITVSSTPGEGSTFTVRLPVA